MLKNQEIQTTNDILQSVNINCTQSIILLIFIIIMSVLTNILGNIFYCEAIPMLENQEIQITNDILQSVNINCTQSIILLIFIIIMSVLTNILGNIFYCEAISMLENQEIQIINNILQSANINCTQSIILLIFIIIMSVLTNILGSISYHKTILMLENQEIRITNDIP